MLLHQLHSMYPQLPNGRSHAATFRLLHYIVAIALISFPVPGAQGTRGNETDRLALLEFKASLAEPLGVLGSWNSSHHFCQWYGVTCGRRHRRVTGLVLKSQHLSGTLSPHIGNLSFLRVVDLPDNNFHSRIPPEVGHLSRLQLLYLGNNSLRGPIPPSLSHCSNLIIVDLEENMLEGHLPADIGSLSKLMVLALGQNYLSGVIPLSVGNLSSLEQFWMAYNNISGSIPGTMGNLRNLKILILLENNIFGSLPSSLTNISSLEKLDLANNQLEGTLIWELDNILPNLQFLSLANNQFTGPIPKSISNMSHLSVLQITSNNFYGDVPSLAKSNLLSVVVAINHLGSGQANDLNFLCSLTNSTNLGWLDVSLNNFGGAIPQCIGNLSITLKWLYVAGNALSGTLPSSIWNLISMEVLAVYDNNISGILPPEIGNLKNMKQLDLATCGFTGQIPDTIGNLSLMTHLSLRENNLSGTIPSSLSKCKRLLLLDLRDNKFTGTIPLEVMTLSSLSIYLELSENNFSGELPVEIGNLKNLGALNLSRNKLSGEIPGSLGSCISLEILDLHENMFAGPIPSTLSSLDGIRELNLSHNRFSGQIPEFLENLNLTSLDLSLNNFEGRLPTDGVFANASATSVMGNENLCGGLPEYQLPKCKLTGSTNHRVRNRIRNASIYTASGILAIVLVLSLLFVLWRRKERRTGASSSSNEGLLKVSYQDLLEATNGFSSANLIGNGSFGSVFRGLLALNQREIAIKVLNLDRHGASKSFIAECEALRNIRHRNLVKVITACSGADHQGNDFKALVYELMVNGSLDEWLHPQVRTNRQGGDTSRQLGVVQRVDIAIDVACALDYLHHQCETPIVHCDLKPSNVLIDGEMTAHVSDFGLVRFMPEATMELLSDQTSSIGVKGSLGYIAPEYGAGGEVSTNGDVYSYGILLLEMFTGKRPTDTMFVDGLNLHSFAKAALPDQVLQIIDPILQEENQDEENRSTRRGRSRLLRIRECFASMLEIGVACSSQVPRDRMSMSEVVAALQVIRKKLLGTRGRN